MKKKFLTLAAFALLFVIVSCNSNGTNPSKVTPTPLPSPSPTTPNSSLIVGYNNNVVYQNGSILAGNGVLSPSSQYGVIMALAVSSSNTLYVGSSDHYVHVLTSSGWEALNESYPDNSSVNALAFSTNGDLYAGTNNGNLYESINGKWCLVFSVTNDGISGLISDNNGGLYAGTVFGNIYHVSNGQETFININVSYQVYSLALDNSNNLFIGLPCYSGLCSGAGVNESINGAWQQVNTSNPGSYNVTGAIDISSEGDLFAGVSNGSGVSGIYESVNGEWQLVNQLLVGYNTGIISIGFESGSFFAVSNLSVYESISGQWIGTQTTNAIPGSLASGLIANSIYVGNTSGDVYTLNKTSGAFEGMINLGVSNMADFNINSVITYKGDIYSFGGGYNSDNSYFGVVYKWSGKGWSQINNTLNQSGNQATGTKMAVDVSGNIFIASDNIVYESINGNWESVNSSVLSNSQILSINCIITDKNKNLFAAVIQSFDFSSTGYIYESINGGWESVNNAPILNINDQIFSINALAVDNHNNLYAATNQGYIYESINGSWESVNNTLVNSSGINAIIFDKFNNIYAGSVDGYVYESVSGIWESINQAPMLDGGAVSSLIIDDSTLYTGTSYGNIYESVAGSWQSLHYTNLGNPVNTLAILYESN